MREKFDHAARWVARQAGRPAAFAAAIALVLVWLASGPFFGWSTEHSLIINSVTTIITFCMVFIIQASQNRDTDAIQLKLDELIRVTEPARNQMVKLEELSEDERAEVKAEFAQVADRAAEPDRREHAAGGA